MQILNAEQLRDRLQDSQDSPVLLDVREPWEQAIAQIPGATLIPMQDIPGRLGELGQDRAVVVMCHHGFRSLQVCQFLEQQGFTEVFNLDGGIDAWAQRVDPSMSRY